MNKSSGYFLSSLGFMLLSALRAMKPLWARIVPVGAFVAVTLVGIAPASVADFAGTWRIQHVSVGDEVVLVLHLRIVNQSGADVVEATVRVDDPVVPDRQSHPSFNGLAIPANESVDLSGDMIVERWVYEQWLAGGQPSVHIEFADAYGNPVSQPLKLLLELEPGGDTP